MQVSDTEKEEKSSIESFNFDNLESTFNQEHSSTGFMNVLRNTSFLILWLGQIFSQLADKVYLVLIIAIISANFQSEGQSISGWVSMVMIAFTIPAVLFGSLAGVYVDRWSKKSSFSNFKFTQGNTGFNDSFLLINR